MNRPGRRTVPRLARVPSPATFPPPGLPGLDPAWSRLVEATDGDGVRRTWHVLDRRPAAAVDPVGTLLCVHGNPTWSYLWRRVLAAAPARWRVVAVDQLGMGWSERAGTPRTLAGRIADLGGLTEALGVTGPVVTVAHDWGGPVSLGWALAHRDQLAGVALTNTAVSQPPGTAAPALIRLARTPALLASVCVRTPAFVRATTALSRPALPRDVRDAFVAPYHGAARRAGVGDFVADIPLDDAHPSARTLRRVADGLGALADVPALLLWGPRDPVFTECYLHDLLERLPHAAVHRYEGASHLVGEDAPRLASDLLRWVDDLDLEPASGDSTSEAGGVAPSARPAPPGEGASSAPAGHAGAGRALWAALDERAADASPAVVELAGSGRSVSWATLAERSRALAAGLAAIGVRRGDRVALLVPPGADLTVAVYACWRAGAAIVVADAGLGVAGMGRALRGARPGYVIGTAKGLAAARAMHLTGLCIAAGAVPTAGRWALGATDGLAGLARRGRAALAAGTPPPEAAGADDECAVVFTSGATGPAKGVVYRHGQVQAQVAVLASIYRVTRGDRLVAGFAPFALYGPALGVASAVPDMVVTAPGTLTAAALADAVAAVRATLVFASPAALRNVVATADGLGLKAREALAGVRLVMSAGAPVPAQLLREVITLAPHAEARTPYGMTEVLPVADIGLDEITAAEDSGSAAGGVCVGRPVPGVEVAVSPLTPDASADGPLTGRPGVTGELCVRAAHGKDRYDRLWATERASSRTPGWHRTGDVGHLDDAGRLWIEGRLVHVVTTAAGVVTPVGPEQRVERLPAVRAAAVVGVGPAGTQQVVVVVVAADGLGGRTGRVAGPELAAAVRAVAGVPVAAVLCVAALPVDIRHQSKVDRARLARWAGRVLAGGRAGRP